VRDVFEVELHQYCTSIHEIYLQVRLSLVGKTAYFRKALQLEMLAIDAIDGFSSLAMVHVTTVTTAIFYIVNRSV
jgi:hypothetical protein